MTSSLALAAVTGGAAALVADVLLQLGLSLVRIDSSGWSWLVPTVFERGRWIVAAVLWWLVTPLVSLSIAGDTARRATTARSASAFELVGRVMLVLPPMWVAATLIMRAVRITLEKGWPYEGRVFLTSDFYGGLIVDYAPWALGGVSLLALSRHLALGERDEAANR